MSAKKPMFQVTKLNPFDCVTDIEQVPCLELSISDNTRELFAWAKVMDAYNTPEDVWFEVHRQKLLNDLKGAAAGRFCLDSNQKTDTPYIDLWQQYCLVTQPLYVPFRRRDYQTFTLDEYNRFIPLNSLIKPMRIPTIQTPTEAATEVARIPYYCSITDRSRQTEELISFLLNDKQEETLIRADQSMEKRTLCGWNNQYSWTVAATYNLYAQVSTPHTMIIQRRGTLLEHAVFLCNLLLGIGIPSFVALGKVKQRPYAWVVTIIHPEQDLFSEREDVDMFRSCTISYSNVDGEQIGYQRSQFRQAVAAARAQEGNRTVQVIHWDPVTGMNFSKPSQLGFNFERVEVVFDASNIFYNVQKSDSLLRPFFSWDLNDLTHWIPFYSEDLKATDPLQCIQPQSLCSTQLPNYH
ncbi:hypothetical protein BC830DRAFT_201968 [Chytriomyces sp. MP71]|nr:hypothetical protein BC830DRAFT_201968 [Chytriomyces sp. MP71]